MTHQLPRLRAGAGHTQPIDRVIEAAFEHGKKQFARDSLGGECFLEIGAELGLQHAVEPAQLLLLTELQAVALDSRPTALAVLSRHEITPVDGALIRQASLSLQKQLHAFAAT